MRNFLLVALLWLATANAFGQGIAIRAANNGRTDLPGAVLNVSVASTNYFINMTNLYVTGSSVSAENGTYTLKSTNSGTGRVIWTNTTARAINKLIPSDPDYEPSSIVFELDLAANPIDGASFLYFAGPTDFGDLAGSIGAGTLTYNAPVAFTANAGVGGSAVLCTWGTNFTATTVQFPQSSNTLITAASPGSVITVDPVNGNDSYGQRGGIPFRTITGASLLAQAGDTINITTAEYTDSGGAYIFARGVTVNGNGATIHTTISVNDNCVVRNLIVTNAILQEQSSAVITTNILCENVTIYRTDYEPVSIEAVNGPWKFKDCRFISNIGAVSLLTTHSNSVIDFINCEFLVIGNGSQMHQGAHGLQWAPAGGGADTGGKVRLYGGSITLLNATNNPYATNLYIGNGCIIVGRDPNHAANATNVLTASMEIYGTVLNHSTVGAGTVVTPIYNPLGMSITGYYYDNTIGSSLSATNSTNGMVFLGGASSSVTNTVAPASVTVGASPFTFVNSTGVNLECFITGGTAYSVSKNGGSIYGSFAGNNYVRLKPSGSLTITYTVAPTMKTNAW